MSPPGKPERLFPSKFWIALPGAYACLLLGLTWARPLWLDEVLELIISREAGFADRLGLIRRTPGAVPLGYEVQHAATHLLGQSVFAARVASEIFGMIALVAVLWAAREAGVRGRLWIGAIWVALPITLRYATEGRGYSQALALASISTALLFRIQRKPRRRWAVCYGMCVLAGLCTQPYSLFLQIGLLAPLVLERRSPFVQKGLWLASGAVAAAGLAFAPWVLWSRPFWRQYAIGMAEDFHLTAKLPLQLFREISGGSYAASIIVVAFMAVGFRSQRIGPLLRRQMLAGITACVLLSLAGDWAFHYFFAARQMLFVLIPMCLLAGEGWAVASSAWRRPYLKWGLVAVFLAASGIKSFRYFSDGSENWQTAARRLLVDTRSSCVLYPASDLPEVFEYFEPGLQARRCPAGGYPRTVILAVTKYTAPHWAREAEAELESKGYSAGPVDRLGDQAEFRTYQSTVRPARF